MSCCLYLQYEPDISLLIRFLYISTYTMNESGTKCSYVCFREPPMCGSSLCSVTEENRCRHKKSVLAWLWISGSSLVFPLESSPPCCSSVSAVIFGRRHASETNTLYISYSVYWAASIRTQTKSKTKYRTMCCSCHLLFAGCSISTPGWWWAPGVRSASCPLQTAVQ